MCEGRPASETVDWIYCSGELKQLRRADLATEKFGKMIANLLKLNPQSALRGLRPPSYEELRVGRVRLDAAVMLLWRVFWTSTSLATLTIALWIDSSPQRHGVEFLATSWDIYTRGVFRVRRKLPALRLERKLFGAFGKAVALLWQIFLVTGPCLVRMYQILSSIRSITTDMGVESGIRQQPDFAQPFLMFIGVNVPPRNSPNGAPAPQRLAAQWMEAQGRPLDQERVEFHDVVPTLLAAFEGDRRLRSRRQPCIRARGILEIQGLGHGGVPTGRCCVWRA